MDQITQAETFCQQWWQLHGSDLRRGQCFPKSISYSDDKLPAGQCRDALLMANHLIKVVEVFRSRKTDISLELVRDKVLVTLFQCLVRLLISQNAEGSWGKDPHSKTNETRDAIKTVMEISRLSIAQLLKDTIRSRMQLAKSFLESRNADLAEMPLGSPIDVSDITTIPVERLPKLESFYTSLPHFKLMERWLIRASLIEGYLFFPTLKSPEHMLYEKEESKWLEYITFVLASNNNKADFACSTEVLLGLMIQMSLLYQIDTFMETIMPTYGFTDVGAVYDLVDEAFRNVSRFDTEDDTANSIGEPLLTDHLPDSPPGTPELIGHDNKKALGSLKNLKMRLVSPPLTPPEHMGRLDCQDPMNLAAARQIMNMFVTHLLNLPAVANANAHDKFWFTTELRDFFIAQTRQVEEKLILSQQGQAEDQTRSFTFKAPKGTYYRWAHTTGSGSVGAPYIFAFMSCMLGGSAGQASGGCWESAEEKYLVERMSQHLAVMCRIENDIGGIRRDRVDCTVNSVNFPEFAPSQTPSQLDHQADRKLAKTLLRLAQHERESWQRDFGVLEQLVSEDEGKAQLVNRLKLFTGFITLYGEIYLARDPWLVTADE